MGRIIKISDFKGVFSNADRALMPPEFLAELVNLRPVNGKLVKTFGMGTKIDTAAPVVADNLYTYIHEQLSGGRLYVLVYVNTASGNAVSLYAWNGASWVSIGSISNISWDSGTTCHKDARNPIVYSDGTVRFLPGNVGPPMRRNRSGSGTSTGISSTGSTRRRRSSTSWRRRSTRRGCRFPPP